MLFCEVDLRGVVSEETLNLFEREYAWVGGFFVIAYQLTRQRGWMWLCYCSYCFQGEISERRQRRVEKLTREEDELQRQRAIQVAVAADEARELLRMGIDLNGDGFNGVGDGRVGDGGGGGAGGFLLSTPPDRAWEDPALFDTMFPAAVSPSGVVPSTHSAVSVPCTMPVSASFSKAAATKRANSIGVWGSSSPRTTLSETTASTIRWTLDVDIDAATTATSCGTIKEDTSDSKAGGASSSSKKKGKKFLLVSNGGSRGNT